MYRWSIKHIEVIRLTIITWKRERKECSYLGVKFFDFMGILLNIDQVGWIRISAGWPGPSWPAQRLYVSSKGFLGPYSAFVRVQKASLSAIRCSSNGLTSSTWTGRTPHSPLCIEWSAQLYGGGSPRRDPRLYFKTVPLIILMYNQGWELLG